MTLIETDLIVRQQEEIAALEQQRDDLLAAQYVIAQGAAQLAIERCKNATGQNRIIDLFVSANLCAEDILNAIARVKESK